MREKLIIDGNAVYELDEDCLCRKEEMRREKNGNAGKRGSINRNIKKGLSK